MPGGGRRFGRASAAASGVFAASAAYVAIGVIRLVPLPLRNSGLRGAGGIIRAAPVPIFDHTQRELSSATLKLNGSATLKLNAMGRIPSTPQRVYGPGSKAMEYPLRSIVLIGIFSGLRRFSICCRRSEPIRDRYKPGQHSLDYCRILYPVPQTYATHVRITTDDSCRRAPS